MSHLRMPGATLVTRLKVYETPGPDGQKGGTPHFHHSCSEMYFVLSGRGAVETIDYAQGFRRTEMPTHSLLTFSAGTLHRLVATEGPFELLIVMQNSGLPERGDTIATFPVEVLADELRFHRAMRAESLSAALQRRDEAVRGFVALKEAFSISLQNGRDALEEVFELSVKLTKSKHDEWYQTVALGAFDEAQQSLQRIIALTKNGYEHMLRPQQFYVAPEEANTIGFCGTLNRYADPATLLPDGVKV